MPFTFIFFLGAPCGGEACLYIWSLLFQELIAQRMYYQNAPGTIECAPCKYYLKYSMQVLLKVFHASTIKKPFMQVLTNVLHASTIKNAPFKYYRKYSMQVLSKMLHASTIECAPCNYYQKCFL